MNEHVRELTDANFETEVSNANGLILVDFWAPWCGPCKMLGPVIDEIAVEYAGKIKVGKLNVDNNRAVAAKFQIMSIPTVMIFKDGQVVDTFVGYQSKENIKERIDKVLQ